MPTNTEWNNVITGNAWSDWNGPWNSGLKLHAAGTLYNTNGGRHDQGSRGVYWAGTQFNTVRGYYMNFSSSYCNMNTPFKSDGINIRCVSDNCLTINNPSQGSHIQTTNQIIWNWTSVSGAAGYKWNTTNDYASATDMGTATSKTETGLTCNTPYTRYAWAYNECGASSPVTLTQSTLACSGGFTCGQSLTINHVAGDVAPVSKNTTYGTVTGIPGEPTKCWITSNLGSDHQATAVDDATEASAGWYWQFNRKQGYKHDGTTRTPNTAWITSINENLDWQTANDPCSMELGSQWRLPTNIEWINVDGSGGWAYWNGPWDSSLKLHAAGGLNGLDGSLFSRGSTGNYWSSTQGITDYGQILFISSGNSSMSNGLKVCAYSVRCLRDN